MSASGASRPACRYPCGVLRLRLVLLLVLVALLAACGGSTPSSGASSSAGASPRATGAPVATEAPDESGDPAASEDPIATDEPEPTDESEPTDDPVESEDPATESPSPGAGGGAAACSGTSKNRDFFVQLEELVDWPVLCGVLPKGWFVAEGSYRLANGGRLIMRYKGPGGAALTLSEGAYCLADADACTPPGADLGQAALGPLGGTLHETTDGFAIVVGPGENPGWLMTTKGLSQETTVALGAALAQVGR